MSYRGKVQNGVVVLEPGANLPEGMDVDVNPAQTVREGAPRDKVAVEYNDGKVSYERPEDDPIYDMSKFAVDTGIPDLGVNIDHYLYGHPKVTDAE